MILSSNLIDAANGERVVLSDGIDAIPLADRVAAGAKLLDERFPGWAAEIREPLEMDNRCGCIIGQRFADYDDGIDTLGLNGWRKSIKYGFDLSVCDSRDENWGELKRLWEEQIAVRTNSQSTEAR